MSKASSKPDSLAPSPRKQRFRRLSQPFALLLVLLNLLVGARVESNEIAPLDLNLGKSRIWLGRQVSFYVDSEGLLDLNQVEKIYHEDGFKSATRKNVGTGSIPHAAFWMHFAIDVPLQETHTPASLLISPEAIDHLTLFHLPPDGKTLSHEGGRVIPFKNREIHSIGHGFDLGNLQAGRHDFYVRLSSSTAINAEASLWESKRLWNYLLWINLTFGIYIGTIGFLIFASAARTLMAKGNWDLPYLSYLVGFETVHLTRSGVPQALGILDKVWMLDLLTQGGMLICSLGFVHLTRTLIIWPRQYPEFSRRIKQLWLSFFGILLLVSFWNSELLTEINITFSTLILVISALFILWAAIRKYPNSRLMAASFIPFISCFAYIVAARRFELPVMDAWSRNQILMLTGLPHMVTLWLLVLKRQSTIHEENLALEREVSNLNSELANQSLLMTLITHELNRPLQKLSLLARTDFLSPNHLDTTQKGQLLIVYKELEGLLEACSHRIGQASCDALTRKQTHLGELISGITKHYQDTQETHLIGVRTTNAPNNFLCDPKLIGILVINLLENAIQHTPEGGAIWVECRMEGNDLVIEVTDDGPGIPLEAQGRIFERYVRLSEGSKHRGMGLGLFIAQRIAKLHGGELVCYSQPGEGSLFRLRIKPEIPPSATS